MNQGRVESENGWWFTKFRINWPEDENQSWHVDLLIANQIIAPVLSNHEKDIILWRFHRRAARDQVGHQFSFIFYSPGGIADQVYGAFKSNEILQEMTDIGEITEIKYDDTTTTSLPNIEDTSDENWSPLIQKSWPYFIQGVCQMWLALITDIGEEMSVADKLSSISELLDLYKEVNNRINLLWQQEGRHPLLHHLSAIFGYVPIIIQTPHIDTF